MQMIGIVAANVSHEVPQYYFKDIHREACKR